MGSFFNSFFNKYNGKVKNIKEILGDFVMPSLINEAVEVCEGIIINIIIYIMCIIYVHIYLDIRKVSNDLAVPAGNIFFGNIQILKQLSTKVN